MNRHKLGPRLALNYEFLTEVGDLPQWPSQMSSGLGGLRFTIWFWGNHHKFQAPPPSLPHFMPLFSPFRVPPLKSAFPPLSGMPQILPSEMSGSIPNIWHSYPQICWIIKFYQRTQQGVANEYLRALPASGRFIWVQMMTMCMYL